METAENIVGVFEADNRILKAEEKELTRLADEARKSVADPMKDVGFYCTIWAFATLKIHSTTLHGLTAVLLLLVLLLCVPFVSALQRTQKLKAQFEMLNQHRRKLLMKSKSYSTKECTDGFLLHRLEVLASNLTSSIDQTCLLGRMYLFNVFSLMLHAVVWVGVFVVFATR